METKVPDFVPGLVYVFCAEYYTYVLHVPFIELSSALSILL